MHILLQARACFVYFIIFYLYLFIYFLKVTIKINIISLLSYSKILRYIHIFYEKAAQTW